MVCLTGEEMIFKAVIHSFRVQCHRPVVDGVIPGNFNRACELLRLRLNVLVGDVLDALSLWRRKTLSDIIENLALARLVSFELRVKDHGRLMLVRLAWQLRHLSPLSRLFDVHLSLALQVQRPGQTLWARRRPAISRSKQVLRWLLLLGDLLGQLPPCCLAWLLPWLRYWVSFLLRLLLNLRVFFLIGRLLSFLLSLFCYLRLLCSTLKH